MAKKTVSGRNVVKTRDDPGPLSLERHTDWSDAKPIFKLSPGAQCGWAKPGDALNTQKLRERIEPWLTALFQSEHLSVLLGSGLTHAVHRMATGKNCPGMSTVAFGVANEAIMHEARASAQRAGRNSANFEDQIRVALELARGLEIVGAKDPETASEALALRDTIRNTLTAFAESILAGECGIRTAETPTRETALNYLVSFFDELRQSYGDS